MKHFILTSAIAAGMLLFTAPATAQYGSGQTNGQAAAKGKRNGPNDGTGNQGQRPQDGSGWGAKSGKGSGNGTCDGTCDGTGPRGNSGQGRGSMGRRGGRR